MIKLIDTWKDPGYTRKLSIKLINDICQYSFPLNDTQSGNILETLNLGELLTLVEYKNYFQRLLKILMASLNPMPIKSYFGAGINIFKNSPSDVNVQPSLRTTSLLEERQIYSG